MADIIKYLLKMKSVALSLALTASCLIASAQSVLGPAVFSPVTPTDHDNIVTTVKFVTAGCSHTQATLVSGSVITQTITLYTCLGGPTLSVPISASLGPLPAGPYTFKLYWQSVGQTEPPTLVLQQALTVTASPPPIPALSPMSLVAVAIMVLTLGLAALTRTPR
jgi:hypothetical protein